ncbi:hypothetical protein [Hydrocarboniphaga sp.]|uniref:hypothetical protein n=1 Tax=Hydrocarboniphaga sp. TaxID=2033016 RepID=UPI002612436E|nr:hypothetical protein [Hydrocarboniphaga sp.]
MKSYSERTGREPDFRVSYRKLPTQQGLFQHIRSNVSWAGCSDQSQQWSIWPEFETSERVPLPDGTEAQEEGTATMWVLYDDTAYRADLRQWIRIGQEGFFMAGPEKFAQFTIIELLGIEAAVQPACSAL